MKAHDRFMGFFVLQKKLNRIVAVQESATRQKLNSSNTA